MNLLSFIYHEILFRPLFNLLVEITNLLPNHSVGLAIIIVTFVIRLLLFPSSVHQAKHMQGNQKKMADMKEQLKKVNEEYKDDPTKKAQITMQLYRQTGVNPLGGCLPLLIQLPVLLALYRVFLVGLGPETWSHLYDFVSTPQNVQLMFLSLNLTKPNLLLGILAGGSQLIQMRLFSRALPSSPTTDDDSAKIMASFQKNMMYVFPVMTVFIAWQLPSALALYWLVTTLCALGQQYLIQRVYKISYSGT